MPLVLVGRIGRTHGVQGEVTLTRSSLSVAELMGVGTFVWRGPRGESIDLVLEGARPAHTRVLARFRGFAGRDEAAVLTNGELWAEAERLPDPGPGTVYAFQLVGLRVETEDGRDLGVLEDRPSRQPQEPVHRRIATSEARSQPEAGPVQRDARHRD